MEENKGSEHMGDKCAGGSCGSCCGHGMGSCCGGHMHGHMMCHKIKKCVAMLIIIAIAFLLGTFIGGKFKGERYDSRGFMMGRYSNDVQVNPANPTGASTTGSVDVKVAPKGSDTSTKPVLQ